MNTVHFLSRTDDWETPQDLFDKLNNFYQFQLDVCATEKNAKCPNFISPEQDGLLQDWAKVNWMNPPYGREISHWIKKAFKEAEKGNKTVALLPSRTDTKWFHDYIYRKHEIRFIKGRLKFGNATNSAPFPSMIVAFNPSTNQ